MRSKKAPKRKIAGDEKYGNITVSKFINYTMTDGKKQTAKAIVYGALEKTEKKLGKPAMEIFDGALKNISPQMEVRSKRVGGANYQIPMLVRPERARALAFRWLISAARAKKGNNMQERLSGELIEAFNNSGDAVKKKMDVHRMAEANRAFAHFARF